MKLIGTSNQVRRDNLFDASGTIASGGTAQLVLAQSQSRSFFFFQNLSSGALLLEFGSARGTAVLTSGVVTSVSITNAGFNFTRPPVIEFVGGGSAGNSSYGGLNQPGGPSPPHPAKGLCVLSGSSLSSVTILDGGSGYVVAPYALIYNSDLDPFGCAVPSATEGLLLKNQSDAILFNATCCPTDAVAVFGASTSQAFTAKWMD